MAKERRPVFFDPETWRALEDHARRHPELAGGPRGMTPSQSAEHLVRQALFAGAGDGLEALLRRIVCEELRTLVALLPPPGCAGGGALAERLEPLQIVAAGD